MLFYRFVNREKYRNSKIVRKRYTFHTFRSITIRLYGNDTTCAFCDMYGFATRCIILGPCIILQRRRIILRQVAAAAPVPYKARGSTPSPTKRHRFSGRRVGSQPGYIYIGSKCSPTDGTCPLQKCRGSFRSPTKQS